MTESESREVESAWNNFWPTCWSRWGDASDAIGVGFTCAGCMLDGERKSIEPMAARLPEGNVQAMQQLIGQSPWPWAPVWQRLAQRMTAELTPDPVWVIDDTGFPKQGRHSVGVARQYSGTLGKTANCQVAVSLHQVGAEEKYHPGLAALLAGKLDAGSSAVRRSGHPGGGGGSRRSGNWRWN